jgi:hypothetical protein
MVLDVDDLAPAHRDYLIEVFGLVHARPREIKAHDCLATRGDELPQPASHAGVYVRLENRPGLVCVMSGGSALPRAGLDPPPLHVRVEERDELIDVIALVRGAEPCQAGA